MSGNDNRHFLKTAASISDASCIGRYMAVKIEHVFNNILLSGANFEKGRIEQQFTLARVLFSNIWQHRIDVSTNKVKMVDTQGMQHGTCFFDCYADDIRVRISPKREIAYKFERLQIEQLEGQSKTRLWVWFPALPKGIYPHRLIFQFWIFAPGNTSGRVQDSETLEVAFAPNFKQYLPDGKYFVPLEIEDAPD
jgi:hypothetical protein